MKKLARFVWRLGRNLFCLFPWTKNLLFPQAKLSAQFGRNDAEYAWRIFQHHHKNLINHGYCGAKKILEVGPGSNMGTSLLFWAGETARFSNNAELSVVLWDVFANMSITTASLQQSAKELLEYLQEHIHPIDAKLLHILTQVEHGQITPTISYLVCPYSQLLNHHLQPSFDLVYSHAALEHVWNIQVTWDLLFSLSAPGCFHSHRIDLADHGRRATNYIEMLEWPEWAYWLTMRFIPGAINRWRASDHLKYLKTHGFTILYEQREIRPTLPIAKNRLASPFLNLDDAELKTTAIDIVARKDL